MVDSSGEVKEALQDPSPVPAWFHYEIMRNTDVKIQTILAASKHKEYLIGLKIAYNVQKDGEEGSPYSMVFGRIDLKHILKPLPIKIHKTGLTDEFLAELYHEVEGAIMEAMQGPGMPKVTMEVMTNYLYSTLPYSCLQIGSRCNGKPVRCYGKLNTITGIRSYCKSGSMRSCRESTNTWSCRHTQC